MLSVSACAFSRFSTPRLENGAVSSASSSSTASVSNSGVASVTVMDCVATAAAVWTACAWAVAIPARDIEPSICELGSLEISGKRPFSLSAPWNSGTSASACHS